jgi:hypothetical protein
MSSIFVVTVVISFIFGYRKPIIGIIAGVISALIAYYVFMDYSLIGFLIVAVVGGLLSTLVAFFSSWFFSGFRGGRHNTGPYIFGGGGYRGADPQIVNTEAELENIKKNEKHID